MKELNNYTDSKHRYSNETETVIIWFQIEQKPLVSWFI